MAERIRLSVAKAATRHCLPPEPFGVVLRAEQSKQNRLPSSAGLGHAAAHALTELHNTRARDPGCAMLSAHSFLSASVPRVSVGNDVLLESLRLDAPVRIKIEAIVNRK